MPTCCHTKQRRYGSQVNQFRTMQISVLLTLLFLFNGGRSQEYYDYYEEGGSPCPYGCSCTEVEADCSNANLAYVPYTLSSSIQRLNLTGNSLSSIDSITSRGFHSLMYIDASSNFISSLDWSSFASMTNLRELYLQMNNLFIVDLSHFSVSNLHVLNVSGNKVISIVTGEAELPIESLYMQDCGLMFFNFGASISFPELKILHAGGNSFSALPNGAFTHMTKLKELKLDNCGLSFLSSDTFSSNAELEFIDISNNYIVNLPDGIFPSSLQRLNLSGNSWLCDCSLIWLKIFMESLIESGGVIDNESSTLCTSPEELSSSITDTSAYSFSGCSGSEQLVRSVRSATAVTSLLNWERICSLWQQQNQNIVCGPEKAASCVYDFASESYSLVQYSVLVSKATTKSDCRDECVAQGALYFVYDDSLRMCLCDNQTEVSRCNDCSTVTRDSPGLCNDEFSNILDVSSIMYDSQLGFSPSFPETDTEVTFSVTGSAAAYDTFSWNFDDGSTTTLTSKSNTSSHTFIYPGEFKITLFLLSSNNSVPSFQMKLDITVTNPYDVGETTCPGAFVSTYQSFDVSARFSTAWNQKIKWTRRDDDQSSSSYMDYEGECDGDWIPFRNRCLLSMQLVQSFTSAKATCSGLGGSLVKLHSDQEIESLISDSQLFPSNSAPTYYTDAQWSTYSNYYRWMSSYQKAFINRDSLTSSRDESCIAVDKLGLKGVDCSTSLTVLCEKDPLVCVSSQQSTRNTCYVHVSQTVTWEEADSWCRGNYTNGMLASIFNSNDNSIVLSMISSSSWLGLQATLLEGHFQWSDGQILTGYSNWMDQGSQTCVEMQSTGQWTTTSCTDLQEFVCEYFVGDDLTVQHLVAGLSSLSLDNETPSVLDSTSAVPTSSSSTLVLLPGTWFSTSGTLTKWYSVLNPVFSDSSIVFHVWRPVCSSGILTPPGCGNNSPFYTCTSMLSSNCSSLRCDANSYFCALSQSCLQMSQPCTCSSNGVTPSINCNSKTLSSDVPSYVLAHMASVTVPAGTSVLRLEVNEDVSEGDIISFQSEHPNHLKCEENVVTEWAHPKILLTHGAWANVGDTIDIQNEALQNAVQCDVSAVYVTQSELSSPSFINYLTTSGSYAFSVGPVSETGESVNCSVTALDSVEGLSYLYPPATSVSRENDSSQVITTNVIAGVPYTLVVKLLRGSNVNYIGWIIGSNNALTTAMNLNCPTTLTSQPEQCQYQTSFLANPYSSLIQTFDYDPVPIEVQVNATNEISFQVIKVLVSSYERVANVTVYHRNCASHFSCKVSVEVNSNETFFIDIPSKGVEQITLSENGVLLASGTSNLTQFSRIFTSAGGYTLEVNASNVVSFMSSIITVNAYVKANFANVFFTSHLEKVAVAEQVDITASAQVTFGSYYIVVWSIGPHVDAFTTTSAGDTTITPSIASYTFTESGIQTISLELKDAFGNNVSVSMDVEVYQRIGMIALSLDSNYVETGEEFVLRIRMDNLTQPDSAFYGLMNFTIDFGDGTDSQSWNDSSPLQDKSHSFTTVGIFTVSVSVFSYYEPTITVVQTITLEAQDRICRLSLTYDGPKRANETVNFQASVGCGTNVTYSLDCGDGTTLDFQTSQEFSHVYTQAAVYEAKLVAKNAINRKTSRLTLYAFDENLLQIIKVSGRDCIALNRTYNLKAKVAAEFPLLIQYDWSFGNGLTFSGIGGKAVSTAYGEIGLFYLTLVVTHPSNNKTDSHSREVCVEEKIIGIEITYLSPVALYPPDGDQSVSFRASVESGSNLTFSWESDPLTGIDSSDIYLVNVDRAGNFSITVRISNDIGRDSQTVVLVAQEIITSLEITCTTCFNSIYATTGENISLLANFEYGTDVRYEWIFENSSILTDNETVNYTFSSFGNYNLSVIAQNEVSWYSTSILIIAQEAITGVFLQTNQTFAEINKFVEFSVSFLKGNAISIRWNCSLDPNPDDNTTHAVMSFNSTGYYDCAVTLSNFISSKTVTHTIPVIEAIINVSIPHNLTHDSTMNLYAAKGEGYLFSADSNTDFLVTFSWELTRNGTWVHSNVGSSSTFVFPSDGEYAVHLNASNDISRKEAALSVICHEKITNLTCSTNSSTENKALLGEILEFTVNIDSGTAVHYEWKLDNQLLPYTNDTIQIAFIHSGESRISCKASNVFGSHSVEVVVKIYEPVSDISIHIDKYNSTLPYVMINDSVHFSAPNVRGTSLSYNWTVQQLSSAMQMITDSNPDVYFNFPSSGSYILILEVSNERSLEKRTLFLLAQAPVTQLQLTLTDITVATRSSVNFTGSVNSDATNITYTWTIDSKTVQQQRYVQIFPSPGSYTIILLAANNISSMTQTETLTVMDPVTGLTFQNCTNVIPGLIDVVFEAAVDGGSNLTYTWNIEIDGKNATSRGKVLNHIFQTESLSRIYIEAENAISENSTDCTFEVQIPINNVAISVTYPDPDYIFLDKTIVFSVSGQNLLFAQFDWTVSPVQSTFLSNGPTLNTSFSALGNYTIAVVAKNDLSEETATLDFCVKLFQCDLPGLSMVGSPSRTVLRSHVLELEVAVDPKGCTEYLAVHSWGVFKADSCNGLLTLAEEVDLGDTPTASPALIIQPKVLETGNYCIRFTTGYQYTPVSLTMHYAVTVEGSHLRAVIRGGTGRTVALGENFCVDADLSYDPDIVTGLPDLTFLWTCIEMTAPGGCFQPSSVGRYCYQGFQEGKYSINLQVSSPGRVGDTAEQIIEVLNVQDFVPIASIVCESCSNLGNYRISASQHVALSANCENCQCDPVFAWTIYEGQSQIPLTLRENETTTGIDDQNLVLKKWGPFNDGMDYTFVVSVSCPSVSGNTGTASLILHSNAPPTGGHCVFSPPEIIPLEDQVTVNCPNWFDVDDPNTLINYQIEVDSTSTINGQSGHLETYVLYTGTDASQSVYLSSFNGKSVTMRVMIADEYGATVVGAESSITFRAASFDNSTKLEYLINQTDHVLSALIKQAAPTSLLQYAIALCQQLNAESEYEHTVQIPGSGTTSEQSRATVRDALTISLTTTVPVSTLGDVKQMSFALRLLTEYSTEYLTEGCQILMIECVERMTTVLQKLSSNGLDRNDIPTSNLLSVLSNLITAANARIYSSYGVWNSGRFFSLDNFSTDFRTLRPEILSKVDGLDLTNITLDETHRQAVTSVAVPLLESVLVATLQSMMVNEDSIQLEVATLKVKALRAYARNMIQLDVSTSSQISFDPSILSSVKNYSDEIFQTVITHSVNPYTFGYTSNTALAMPVQSLSFYETNGSVIHVQNLEPESRPNFYTLNYGQNLSGSIEIGLLNESSVYNPFESLVYKKTNISAKQANEWKIPSTSSYISSGTGLHVQIRVNFLTNDTDMVTSARSVGIYMAKNYRPSSVNHDQATTLTLDLMESDVDHRQYTLFIRDLKSTDEAYIRAENNDDSSTVELSVAIYYSYCQYFDTIENEWSSDGCEPMEESIATVTVCQCNHLTSFGGSGFVSLSDIHFEDLGNIDLVTNPFVFVAVACIFIVYVLLAILCRYLDVIDLRRIAHIPLCGRDGAFKYEITVVTGRLYGAGTSAHVGMKLYGEVDKGEARHIIKAGAFQRNCSDTFLVAYDVNLGDVTKLLVWHDNTGLSPSWYLSQVEVKDVQTGALSTFVINSWLSLERKDGVIQKTIKKADEEDVRKSKLSFASVFSQKLSDFHVWLSVSHRPDHSRFTRFQRATCCLTAIYMYMCVNAMWYGLIKNANDVNESIHINSFGWEEVIIALVSAMIILPFVLGLMFLFKKTRCKDSLFEELHRPSTAQTLEIEAVCDMSRDGMSLRTVTPLGDWIPAIDRESTTDSLPAPGDLKRTAPMHRGKLRRGSGNMIKVKAAVPGGGKKELWNEDNIMQNWPHKMPTWIKEVKADVKVKNKAGSSTKKWIDDDDKDDDLDRQLDELDAQIAKDEEKQRRRQLVAEKRRKRVSSDDLFDSDDEWVNEDLESINSKEDFDKSTFNPRGEAELISLGDRSKASNPGREEVGKSNKQEIVSHSFLSSRSRSNVHSRDVGRIRSLSNSSQPPPVQPNTEDFSFPPWFIFVVYTICVVLCVISCIMIMLYGYQFGSSIAVRWLLSLFITLLISFLILEPLKVLAMSIIVTWITKDVRNGDRDLIDVKPNIDGNEQIKDVKFKPLGGFALLQAKEEGKQKQRLHTLMRELVIFTFMFIIFLATVYINYWSSSIYHANANILNKFQHSSSSLNVSDLKSINEYWNWTQESMATSVHLEELNLAESFGRLMGRAWLRQIRSERVSCPAATERALPYIEELDTRRCVNEASDNPDTNPYMVGWVNSSTSLYNYSFSSAEQLDMFSKFGQWLFYQGGGYIQYLGTTYSDTLQVLSNLQSDGWMDLRTRAVFMEVTLYNPSDDFASCVTVLTEFPISGGVMTQITVSTEKLLRFASGVVDPLMVCEVLFTPFIIYFLVMLVLSVKGEGLRYLTHFWSWVDIVICILAPVCLGLYITCVSMATEEIKSFLDNRAEPANLFIPVLYHTLLRYMKAVLLLLFHLKIVKQIRFVRPLYKFYMTLAVAKGPLSGVCLIFLLLLLAYSSLTHLIYVSVVEGYRSYGHAFTSLFGVMCGPTTFTPLFEAERVLTHIVFLSFGLFVYGLTIALIVAVLSFSYKCSRSQMCYKTSLEARDYEMVDFFLKRFKLMTGIEKPKPAFRHVKFEGLPSLPSRGTSSNLSSRQSCSSPISGSTESGHLDLNSQSLDYLMASLLPTWDQVTQSFQKIEELEKQEEDLTKRLQDTVKNLSHTNKNSQGMQLKVFSTPTIVGKPPLDPKASFTHVHDRNGSRKPTLIRGRASMTPPSTFSSDASYESRSNRPFSDQGIRSGPNQRHDTAQSMKLNGSAHERGSPGPGFYCKNSSSSNKKQPLDVTALEDRPKRKQKEAWKSSS